MEIKKNFACCSGSVTSNVYLFPYNDDWLKNQQLPLRFQHHKKGTQTHKIVNAKWKRKNLRDCTKEMSQDEITQL